MGWWKRLRVWQKAGLLVGSIHLILYMAIYFLLSPVAFILYYFELPWLFFLMKLNIKLDLSLELYTVFILIGFIGTIFYTFFGMAVGWLFSTIIPYSRHEE